MNRRAIGKSDLPRLLGLWCDCFSEKEETARLFFERNLSDTHGYLAEENGAPIAAVYLVGCTLCGKPAHYLCGAATRREYRGRGVMTALIDFALRDAQRRGDCYSVLLPASEGLYRFYGRMGYVPCGAVCRKTMTTDGGKPVDRAGEPDWEALQQRCHKDKFLLWNKNYIRFAAAYYACYGVTVLQNAHVFALLEQNGAAADVFYAVYDSIEELKYTLSAAGVRRFTLTGCAEAPLFSGCEAQRCGMAKSLQGGCELPGRVFIGLTMN